MIDSEAAGAAAPARPALRTLVVDDDPLARRHLRSLLEATPDAVVVQECGDGREAVEVLRARGASIDVVLLDVQMPELDGFGVLAEVGAERMPPVIFTSAYSEFAVRAFESYALDYLLKPVDPARLDTALERARRRVADTAGRQAGAPAAESADEIDARLLGLLEHLRRVATAQAATPADRTGGAGAGYPDAMAVKVGPQYAVIRIADIDWIEADGNYARLHVQKRVRVLGKSLVTLERHVLDPRRFVRIHRSAIVNLAKIAAVEPQVHGELTLVLYDGTRVDCSRRYRKALEDRLYFAS